MPNSLSKLEKLIDCRFTQIELLERALTHRSWANEKLVASSDGNIHYKQNERLEFVGDSVLGLAIAEELFRLNPDLSEGDLTLMKHHLVSAETLAKLAEKLDLGRFMRIGRGEEKTGGRKKNAILADTLEAVIGAIFFDSGYLSARRFVVKLFLEEITNVTPKSSLDYKTLLQETLQAEKRDAPKYSVIKTDGPPHIRFFTVEAVWDSGKIAGGGSTIKSAEMEAARLAIDILDSQIGKPTEKV